MNKNLTSGIILLIIVTVSFAGGWLLAGMVENERTNRAVVQAEDAEQRANEAHWRAMQAEAKAVELEAMNEHLLRLSSSLTTKLDSITLTYGTFRTRVRSADRAELRLMLDSLLAGYVANRDRYRLLLDSAGTDHRRRLRAWE